MRKRLSAPCEQNPALIETPIGAPIPIPPTLSFPFLLLPTELRFKIYRYLFRTTVPVCPATTQWARYHNRAPLKRPSFPVAVFLLCHQVYEEASSIFWGENEIIIRFPLDWKQQYGRDFCELTRPYECFIPPVHSLAKVQNLTLEVFLFRGESPLTAATRLARPGVHVKKQLTELSDGLKAGHRLNAVEIRFCNWKPRHNPHEKTFACKVLHWSEYNAQVNTGSVRPRLASLSGCCYSDTSIAFARSNLSERELEGLCRQANEIDQQVLKPLTEISDVSTVRVVGRVTSEWADYLKRCMERRSRTMPPASKEETGAGGG